jgi:UDP-galactopyranose mutase
VTISADYIVVGAGLTGATVARTLADAGREVVVVDRRPYPAGNCADRVHVGTGLRYGLHGPHYFRTNSLKIWEWANRFCRFYPWAARVKTCVWGNLYRWPLTVEHRHLYCAAVDDYNKKMWGTAHPPAEVTRRIEDRRDEYDDRLKTDKYQGLPEDGYTLWIARMLRDIPVVLDYDYVRFKEKTQARVKVVYTGAVDELFSFVHGRLRYRSQQRKVVHLSALTQPLQDVVQVNWPQPDVKYIRCVEWNYCAEKPRWNCGVLATYETPADPQRPDQYEYPYNDAANSRLYEQYRCMANVDPKLVVCGRLGVYRYLDMDQCIASAMLVAERMLREQP